MNLLTIAGIRESLEYVRDHADVKYHNHGPRKGMIVTPEDFTPEQGYSLFLVQKFTPKLTVQLLENVTGLTLDGQELLDILSDEVYLAKVSDDLKTIGYTSPSDRQIFREVRRRLEITDFTRANPTVGAKELFREFFQAAQEVSLAPVNGLPNTAANEVTTAISQSPALEQINPEVVEPALVVEVPETTVVVEEPVATAEKAGVGSSLVSNGPTINVQGGRADRQRKGRN